MGTTSLPRLQPGPRSKQRRRLPPGQRPVEGFPRFGTHLHRPPPAIPGDPLIEISGAVTAPFAVPASELTRLPRRELTADFHCVAGWSATHLRWEGVPFETFYRTVIEPSLRPGAAVSHVVFAGLDGYRSTVELGDALQPDVLIADRLDGRPLSPDHGAPTRLVSPGQYGFVSTKHLCRIELHTQAPPPAPPAAIRIGPVRLPNPLIRPHPRARVWKEERHASLPAWSLRWIYRRLIRPIAKLSALGSRNGVRRL